MSTPEFEIAPETQEKNPRILFLLGAGASVKANVPTTYEMVDKFLAKIQSVGEDSYKALLDIKTTLEKYNLENQNTNSVDVEQLLATLEELENREKNPLLRFYEFSENQYRLQGYPEKGDLAKALKRFIREIAVVRKEKVGYLLPLLDFVEDFKPLDIFSLNYDIAIEQFCNVHRKLYYDGFESKWHPDVFKTGTDADVFLYKLHGSISWYRTDSGDFIKIPVESYEEKIKLLYGESAETVLIYPVRKWDYIEPMFEMISILKQKLKNADLAIVVGYSFRDNHIRDLFWDAARENKNLLVFLIGPSSFRIYKDTLAYNHKTNTESALKGRVICLPYKFEDILPSFKHKYYNNYRLYIRENQANRMQEIQTGYANWKMCLNHLAECEYVEKFEEIFERHKDDDWVLESPGGLWAAKKAFKILLTYACLGEKPKVLVKWFPNFISYLGITELSTFDTSFRGAPWNTVNITFVYGDNKKGTEGVKEDIEELRKLAEDRHYIARNSEKNVISAIIELLKNFESYLEKWRGGIEWEKYINSRKDKNPQKVERLKQCRSALQEAIEFSETRQSESAGFELEAKDIVKQIEQETIEEIFDIKILQKAYRSTK